MKHSKRGPKEHIIVTHEVGYADIQPKVTSAVKDLIDKESDSELDVHAPVMELGIDSLGATELIQRLSNDLGLRLAPTLLFDYPTVDELSNHLWVS